MTPDELKSLNDNRVWGDHIASGVEQNVTWEVRERAAQAPWDSRDPEGRRKPTVVRGEYRITVALPRTEAVRTALAVCYHSDVLVVAGHTIDSRSGHGEFEIVGYFAESASVDDATEHAKSWCRDCVARGYVQTVAI